VPQVVTLKSRLPTIAASLRPRVSAAVKQGAQVVAEDAKTRVDLGPAPEHVRDGIKVVRHEAAGYLVVAEATDPKGVPYPFALEFGSVHAPAYPFLVPALEANAATCEQFVAASLRGL
jgi:HK97 gp10 family phage protein